jgi:hypothetical protein
MMVAVQVTIAATHIIIESDSHCQCTLTNATETKVCPIAMFAILCESLADPLELAILALLSEESRKVFDIPLAIFDMKQLNLSSALGQFANS